MQNGSDDNINGRLFMQNGADEDQNDVDFFRMIVTLRKMVWIYAE